MASTQPFIVFFKTFIRYNTNIEFSHLQGHKFSENGVPQQYLSNLFVFKYYCLNKLPFPTKKKRFGF